MQGRDGPNLYLIKNEGEESRRDGSSSAIGVIEVAAASTSATSAAAGRVIGVSILRGRSGGRSLRYGSDGRGRLVPSR